MRSARSATFDSDLGVRGEPSSSTLSTSSRARPLLLSARGFLPRRAGLDVDGGRARQGRTSPAGPQAMSFRAVVHAQVLGCCALGDQKLDDGHDLVGVAAAPDPHRQSLAGVLVDDDRQLQPPMISGLVELEVEGPRAWLGCPAGRALRRPGPAGLALVRSSLLRPSQRHRRWVRLRLMPSHPGAGWHGRSSSPSGDARAMSRWGRRSLSSSSGTRRFGSRWVERHWPLTGATFTVTG